MKVQFSKLVLVLISMIFLVSCGGGGSVPATVNNTFNNPKVVAVDDFTKDSVTKELPSGEKFTIDNIKEVLDIPIIGDTKVYTTKIDENNNGFFMVNGDSIEGTFTKDGKTYSIGTFKDGQKIVEVKNISDGDTLIPSTQSQKIVNIKNDNIRHNKSVGKPEIKILFVYNEDFWAWCDKNTNTVTTKLNSLIAYTNTAFARSAINATVSIAGSSKITFSQDKSGLFGALNEAQQKMTNEDDSLYELREQYKADIVFVLRKQTAYIDWGGVAYYTVFDYDINDDDIRISPHYSIGMEDVVYGIDHSSFTHELGHIFGCKHDAQTKIDYANTIGEYNQYANGYWFESNNIKYTTMMGYRTDGRIRIQNFSNPNINYEGVITGIVGDGHDGADCARFINFSAPLVADYKVDDFNATGRDEFLQGDIDALVDSRTIYISTKDNILKSNDSGNTLEIASIDEYNNFINNINNYYSEIYENNKDFFYNNAIEDIIITNEGKVYVATYLFAVYQYLTDGTLSRLDDGFNFPSSPGTIFHDSKNNVLYAGTYWDGVYKFENNKWSQLPYKGLPVNSEYSLNLGVSSITISTDGTLFALLRDQLSSHGIYRYDEDTKQWYSSNDNLTSGLILNIDKIVSNNQNEIFITSNNRGIFRKNVQENKWTELSNGVDFYPTYITKTLTDIDNQIFVLSYDKEHTTMAHGLGKTFGIFNSLNNGKTWTEFSDGMTTEYLDILGMEIYHDKLYVITYNFDLYYKPLIGGEWTRVYTDFPSSPNAIVCDNINNIIYVNTYHNGVYKSIDDGKTFVSTNSPNGGSYDATLVLKDNILYLSYNGLIYISNDNGDTWKEK